MPDITSSMGLFVSDPHDAATTTTTSSCHHKEAKLEAGKSSCTMENAPMKSRCLPGDLLDGLRNGEFVVRVEVYRGF